MIRGPALACALAVALVAASCGGDDGGDADGASGTTATSTTTTAPPTTVDEKTQKEEAAKAAYLAYWDAYREATAHPVDPDLPAMQELMTGDHQRVVTRDLEDRQSRGEAARLPPNPQLRHEILSAELEPDGSVHIRECEINDAIVYDVASETVINDDVVTKLGTAKMVQEGGVWKIADSAVVERWSGAVECTE